MLVFGSTPPEPVLTPFYGGAYAYVRPATSFDYERARAEASRLILGLAESADAAALYGIMTGDATVRADLTARDAANAVEAFVLALLACACVTEISGIAIGERVLTAPLSHADAVTICRDVTISTELSARIFARLAQETAEGNGSSPSRAGEPGAAEAIATTAAPPEMPARKAGGRRKAPSARKPSTAH